MNATELGPQEVAYLLEVMDLARSGKCSSLAEQLDGGISVNLTNGAGDTLLILAAYHRHLDVVEMLLARGADHARRNGRGQTALGCAVFRQEESLVIALLRAGADPHLGSPAAIDIARFFQLGDLEKLLFAVERASASDVSK